MRVLALTTDSYSGGGGIAQAARDLLSAIASRVDVDEIEIHPRNPGLEDGPALPKKMQETSAMGNKLRYMVRAALAGLKRKPDIVLCNHLYLAPAAWIVSKLTGAALIIQLHGIEVWPTPSGMQRRALEAADLILCVSRNTRARLLTHCRLTPERAVVFNNTFENIYTCPKSAPAPTGKADRYTLLSVGRLAQEEQYKGHDRVIGALKEVMQTTGKDIEYLIAGSGSDMPRLQAMVESLSLQDHVTFLGRVPYEALPGLYRDADMFILPSAGEGFGIVFVEAMASGTPAVGLKVGGAPDALADGQLGHFVELGDGFAPSLADIISGTPLTGEALSKAIYERFGESAFRSRLTDLIDAFIIEDRDLQEVRPRQPSSQKTLREA